MSKKPKSLARQAFDLITSPFAGMSRRSIEDPNVPLTLNQLAEVLGGWTSNSGKQVSVRGSLKIAAVWACVQIVSNSIARMPLITYEVTDKGRQRAKTHPLYRILKTRPNPDMSAFAFRKALVVNLLLGGRGCAEIVQRGDGQVEELYPIEWDRIQPFRKDGELMYRYTDEKGTPTTLLKRDVLHIPGLSFDGVNGLSVIGYARETLGGSLAREEFNSAFYRNGLRISGILEHPGSLGVKALANLRKSFIERNAGPDHAWKPLILEEAMKYTTGQTMMSPEDAQFVESQYVTIEDICRWFGVQPHKIHHLLRSTNNNIEQQGLDFLGDTLSPITEAIEQEFNYKLLTEDERDRFYCEHLTQAIVQMDANARGQLYQRLAQISGINADEIRERENLNNVPDGRGKQYYVPANMMPAMTQEQADRYIEALIKKGGAGGGGPGSDQTGGGGNGDPAKVAPPA